MSLLSLLTARDAKSVVAIDAHPTAPVEVRTGELLDRVRAVAGSLRRAGIGRGDCVAVWLPNWSDALCWQFATASLGAHVIGVNTRYNVDEVRHVLHRARPKVIAVAHDFHGLDLADRLRRAVDDVAPAVAVVAGPHGEPPADLGHYDVGGGAWVAGGEGELSESGDELAVAFTTSGSTGKPKLAAHRASAVVEHARRDAECTGIGPGDVVVCALPLSGVFGFNTAMATIAGGGTCLLEPVFEEHAVLADMARWRATHLVGGDDLVVRLADAWRGEDLKSWRWLGMADFIGKSESLAKWAQREFGTATTGVYGSSEVFALTAMWPLDEPAPRRWRGGGRLVSPRIEARVADGELQLRGPNVVDAYLGDPDVRSFTDDGWFRTGDLAEIAEDGGITFICRMGDVLRLRGFLVDPAEIEHRLAEHEAVVTAKVVGVRGDEGDEAVGFVVAEGDVDGETLREWCGETLAKFKVPAQIHVIDEMPTTSGTNGTKIRAAALRERAQREREAAR
ncbi:AMP-binding protein [Amycolatopsis acidiphila]|uniref:Long-chain-fatty-acid--CoA ligase n=1 Tax=Amycolatopsis acidiphila TaxID=715473 RepID=A0A558AK18_9PSEU|nr:AMP-binding protein [Amycolatopsis acidiphila]TVT24608.1 AMP-binding protein [Amycolatopsis acidiphila]UIJ58557.1 AMP-binding protein [Amycolatopsis acidiphila]GHG76869.1 acyl-CoA synthetase [Amycolatopsis acidiphila]